MFQKYFNVIYVILKKLERRKDVSYLLSILLSIEEIHIYNNSKILLNRKLTISIITEEASKNQSFSSFFSNPNRKDS